MPRDRARREAGHERAAAVQGAFRALGGLPARPGTVYLVGGGPGDPALLTLRAAVLLSTCDLVLYDSLAPPEALELVPPSAERVCVGKRFGEAGFSRDEVDRMMVAAARDGAAVVRLKGGDPFVFGRGGEEAQALDEDAVPYEVVAGVTSATAVPGAAGIPLTHRGVAAGFAVATGHEDPGKGAGHVNLRTLARYPGTLVFLMGVSRIAAIAADLVRHGRDPATPVTLIRWGTTARQEVLDATLETVADEVRRQGLRPPAVAVVGDVVRLRQRIGWRERLPLHGVRVLVTRARAQAPALAAAVRTLGGEPVLAPTIELRPGDRSTLADALDGLRDGAFAGVAFTSPNGVDAVADVLGDSGLDARVLATTGTVAAVGPGTAARLWERLRVRADLVPSTSTTAALAEAFPPGSGRVLLPRADLATPTLPEALAARGYEPVRVTAYVTARPAAFPTGVADQLAAGEIDLLAFASSSTVRNFHALVAGRAWSGRVVSIGPVTSRTCRELGLDVFAEADPHDLDGLVQALCRAAAELPGRRSDGEATPASP